MKQKDKLHYETQLLAGLERYEREVGLLNGITYFENRQALIEQIIDSIRRVQYVQAIGSQQISQDRVDPNSSLFDPLKAAVFYRNNGNHDEACWLVYLAIHFGKHLVDGWRLTRDIYGALGMTNGPFTWQVMQGYPNAINDWLSQNYQAMRNDGVSRRFGNHRKYETLRPTSKGTGAAVRSYVDWVMRYGSHGDWFDRSIKTAQGDRREAFSWLYRTMRVHKFGRTAKFDYLTMLAKLDLAPIEANSAYLTGATGPLSGAKLLYGGRTTSSLSADKLDASLIELAKYLDIGMQEMEDALCNWQKSPGRYVAFRG
ncbi:hypothetical protein [Hydrogenovibrio sp. SC-1]|uniref:alpha-glutamyl/putrescinyl thymine pyrophosphorylase clade 3 protein n=1 Tax=Hydrogenovibrio sp. SC-1 TaxID=2065820 RepID=UPI00117BC322|nr:hypothetical protein [Hydrogenovibrio sp. SC-1]